MNTFSKKGYRNVRVQHPETGEIKNISVKIGSSLDRRIRAQYKRTLKAQKEQARQFHAQLRQAKKAIPLEHRGEVNWSEVENV